MRPLTPKEVARAAMVAWESAERRLEALREQFERARYSPHPISTVEAEEFCRTVHGLIDSAAPGGRAA